MSPPSSGSTLSCPIPRIGHAPPLPPPPASSKSNPSPSPSSAPPSCSAPHAVSSPNTPSRPSAPSTTFCLCLRNYGTNPTTPAISPTSTADSAPPSMAENRDQRQKTALLLSRQQPWALA